MKKGVVALLALAIGIVVSVAPAMAHHSFSAEFDGTKAVTMKGYVTKVEWTNPHVWFYIDVKAPCRIQRLGLRNSARRKAGCFHHVRA